MTVTVPLQIVKHSECDEDDFFTLSASGVTHFQSGKADFTQLVRCPALPRRRRRDNTNGHTCAPQEQWQREYYLFNEVLHVRLFRVYRIWKAFRVWRNFVWSWKMRQYSESLEKNLFMLNGIFRAGRPFAHWAVAFFR